MATTSKSKSKCKGNVGNTKKPANKKQVKKTAKNPVKKNNVPVVTITELQNLVETALHMRFVIMCVAKDYKKGTFGEQVISDIDKMGPAIRKLGVRLGMDWLATPTMSCKWRIDDKKDRAKVIASANKVYDEPRKGGITEKQLRKAVFGKAD